MKCRTLCVGLVYYFGVVVLFVCWTPLLFQCYCIICVFDLFIKLHVICIRLSKIRDTIEVDNCVSKLVVSLKNSALPHTEVLI
jgi:hypothetical protein